MPELGVDSIRCEFFTSEGPQIWYSDGNIAKRLDSPKDMEYQNRRDLRLMKAVLTEALIHVNEWLGEEKNA